MNEDRICPDCDEAPDCKRGPWSVRTLLPEPMEEGHSPVDHICHDPETCTSWEDCPHHLCVNPAHLRLVTIRENVLRGTAASRPVRNAVKTHCDQGHLFDEANTYIAKDGSRHCRACHRRWANERNRKKREGLTS